ncbi:hypothetical protein J2X16_002771 [Pelomonas aquatica]|uniref:Uncharacterized protein n=1 Tax=Pelomonas aquatica TaxID=431058 RepID=A0ABU1Z9Z2_9BURK|nr:hypothetical protein [Pelomonas aquatica]MDR7297422.1 hypothetical protein [Pelomonas aquatica]
MLSAASNVKVMVGVTPRRWVGTGHVLWEPPIAKVLASYASNPTSLDLQNARNPHEHW